MSLQSDFYSMIQKFYDIEQFNMWNPNAHLALAYVMDKLYASEDYDETIEKWNSFIQENDYLSLAWDLVNLQYVFLMQTPDLSEEEREYVERRKRVFSNLYSRRILSIYDLVSKERAPQWFWEVFGAYMPLEEIKRETVCLRYCVENGMTKEQANQFYQEISQWYDFHTEFTFLAKAHRLRQWFPSTAESQTAQMIIDKTGLSPLGAYKYLLYLREKPEEALQKLNQGVKLISPTEWE